MFEKLKSDMEAVVDCQNGLFHAIMEQRPSVMVFKTTNYCYNNCAHCCEDSGIHNPKTFIPESVICGYLNQAAKDEKFAKTVIFTGGEVMSAYKFVGKEYVPNIIKTALRNKIGVNIKTNAGWVNGGFAKDIYQDINKIVRSQAPKDAAQQSFKTVVKFEVSLTMDRFHKNALQRNFEFVKHFANINIPGITFSIHVSSLEQDKHMIKELLEALRNDGVKIDEMFSFDALKGGVSDNMIYSLNGNLIIRTSSGKLFNGGRAKNIDWAYKTPYPQFVFVNEDVENLVAFDSFGNVTLGENSGKKITTPWKDKNGNALPLQTIRENLIAETKKAEQEFLSQHKIMDSYFNWIRKRINPQNNK